MVMNKLLQVHQNKLCIKLVKIVLSNLSCKKFEPCHFKKNRTSMEKSFIMDVLSYNNAYLLVI